MTEPTIEPTQSNSGCAAHGTIRPPQGTLKPTATFPPHQHPTEGGLDSLSNAVAISRASPCPACLAPDTVIAIAHMADSRRIGPPSTFGPAHICRTCGHTFTPTEPIEVTDDAQTES